jgi:hypothetical protein
VVTLPLVGVTGKSALRSLPGVGGNVGAQDIEEASMSESPHGRFEVFDANARFVVIRDGEGYGVWRLDDLEEGQPIERFPDDDEGYERAAERWRELTKAARRDRDRWLPRIKWVVLVSAVVWALSGALSGALFFEVGVNFDQGDLFQELFKWAQLANSVAQPLTVGGFAAYVILWLEIRRRQERFVSGPRGSG